MILLLVTLPALAAGLDPEELADAELDAIALIEACHYGACPYDANQLAEAFLIRAMAAAVLRGEIDTSAAANARFLAPDLDLGWGAVLPSGDRDPEGWVRYWAGPKEALPPGPARLPVAPAKVRPPPVPLRLDGEAPIVARMGVTPQLGRAPYEIDGDLRLPIGGTATSLVVSASAGMASYRGTDFTRYGHAAESVQIRSYEGTVRLGAGPRWTSERGHDLVVFGGLLAETAALSWSTWSHFAEEMLYGDPAYMGFGAELGAISVVPLRRRLDLQLDGGAQVVKRVVAAGYLDGRRQGANPDWEDPGARERDEVGRDGVRIGLAADVRWRPPSEGPLFFSGGVDGFYARGVGRWMFDREPRLPTQWSLRPRIGASLAF